MTNNQLTEIPVTDGEIQCVLDAFDYRTGIESHEEYIVRCALAELQERRKAEQDSEPVAFINGAWKLVYYRPQKESGLRIGDKFYRHSQPAPDQMLCDFYEVNSWPDLVRKLVKHVEQLQDSAKRNVKPWEDTLPETLLPAYIERIKQADEACRAAMLQAGDTVSGNSFSDLDLEGMSHGNNPQASAYRELLAYRRYSPVIGIDPASGPDRTVEVRYVAPPGYVMVPKEPTDDMCFAPDVPVGNKTWDGYQSLADMAECKAIYEAMLAAAPAGIPMNSNAWIPVSERMPETDGNYWGWWSESKRQGPVWFIKSELQAQFQSHEITHWMPLQAAPQEVK